MGVTVSCIHLLAGEAADRAGIDGARRRSRASLALAFPISALAECMSRITLAIFVIVYTALVGIKMHGSAPLPGTLVVPGAPAATLTALLSRAPHFACATTISKRLLLIGSSPVTGLWSEAVRLYPSTA